MYLPAEAPKASFHLTFRRLNRRYRAAYFTFRRSTILGVEELRWALAESCKYGLANGDSLQDRSNTKADTSGSFQGEDGLWTIEFRDIPEPGKQAVTTRLLSRTPVDGGDLIHFVKHLGYEYETSFSASGVKAC